MVVMSAFHPLAGKDEVSARELADVPVLLFQRDLYPGLHDHQVIRNSLFVSTTTLILVVFGLAKRLDFLAASKKALFAHCGTSIATFTAVLGIKIFAATLAITRKILLCFGTHLRAYLQLFWALPRFEFIYIAPIARLFQAAESQFHHVLYGKRALSTSVNILDYFHLREAWDAKERVASADAVLLKEAQQRYAGSKVENLYEEWRRGVVTNEDVTRIAEHSESRKATFLTLVCGASLKVFSDPLGCDTESWMEREVAREVEQDSGQSSIQVSGT
jgi:hypothetical protein